MWPDLIRKAKDGGVDVVETYIFWNLHEPRRQEYHGGTNFGRTSGGPYITTSYDYDAPLDEYGNLNQPKWGHLKQLMLQLNQGRKSSLVDTLQLHSLGTMLMLIHKPLDDKETKLCVNLIGTSWNNANLSVNTSGHVLHAFVNRKLVGSQWGTGGDFNFLFNKAATFNSGTKPTGINGGPVKLLGSGSDVMDLSSNSWSYKVGLVSEAQKFHNGDHSAKWSSNNLPDGQPFTWYKDHVSQLLEDEYCRQWSRYTSQGREPCKFMAFCLQTAEGYIFVLGHKDGHFWTKSLEMVDIWLRGSYSVSLEGCLLEEDLQVMFRRDNSSTFSGGGHWRGRRSVVALLETSHGYFLLTALELVVCGPFGLFVFGAEFTFSSQL
ncbi:hypothetical protein GH714_028044 [Hevea brasiliensis]|uniref:beta-galactosidase n=1 Tax=Hevea brasiliensis TaxID=3981 RepID=A0A6A6LUG6_HEVBR|nr:hypothetical protein GH714_028044 [Hevea brasiliensis]